jgi:rod shape-determining protein MreC
MREPGYRFAKRLAVPLRGFAHRFVYPLLVLGAFALMILGKADLVLIERMRATMADALAPILSFMSEPAARVADAIEQGRELIRLREENNQLRRENERLRQWQLVATRLEQENVQLRDLARLVAEPPSTMVSARVVADAGGIFVHSVLIGAGARAGIGKGNAVMTSEGLAGRVATLGDRSARVLLLTDLNSRIPVMIESTRERAMLAGDNSHQPRLLYLPSTAHPSPGERIVTSGDGGSFPPGLPVGIIADTGDAGAWRVLPFVDFNRLEFVRVVDFKIEGPVVQTEVPRGRERR